MNGNWTPTPPAGKPGSSTTNAFANLNITSRTGSPASTSSGSKPNNAAFANLVSFGNNKSNANLTLAEQQQRLQQEKLRQQEEERRKMDELFGGGLESFGRTPAAPSSSGATTAAAEDDDDDLFAAFKASAPVDRSSHYPAPTSYQGAQSQQGPALDAFDDLLGGDAAPGSRPTPSPRPQELDPFDVEHLSRQHTPYQPTPPPQAATQDDDFDILGDLAKPVDQLPKRQPTPPPREPTPPAPKADPRDAAIAEIVDMGFAPEQAARALEHTQTGLDTAAAVSWLLDEAHRKARPAPAQPSSRGSSASRQRDASRGRQNDNNLPAWARSGSGSRDSDLSQRAAELGGNLFKSANSLWAAGRKKVERAVAEFQADLNQDDPNMPKWMRERQIREQLEARGARGITRNDRPEPAPRKTEQELTDEALMLEMAAGPPPPRRRPDERRPTPSHSAPPDHPDAVRRRDDPRPTPPPQPPARFREPDPPRAASAIPDSATRKAKLAADDDAGVYVSRNRRRPPPAAPKPASPAPDLLATSSSTNPFAADIARERAPPAQTPTPTPPPASSAPTPLPLPPLDPATLTHTTATRHAGSAAFKLGDYPTALTHYTTAITALPPTHPLLLPLLTNRALTHLKLGDPKSALADTSHALTLLADIPAHTTLALDGHARPLADYRRKALHRRAEALEALERWADAKGVWEEAIAAGVAGAGAGRARCERALAPKPAAKQKPAVRPHVQSRQSAAAVRALRETHAAAERVEAEKAALYDAVEARVGAWKSGKEGNLRALLAGLDTVLWEGSGWRKVGLGELLQPGRVKVVYMKGIAKVHPDKIAQDATTEQRMISAAVFSLLNEAWDRFKAENGL